MSYNCDECGKNPVEQYGLWCNECQQREAWLWEEDQARWFSSSAKCQQCGYCWGPDPSDRCEYYDMPLSMVKRKKKCKRFKEINYRIIN